MIHTTRHARIGTALALAASAALLAGCQQVKQLVDELQPVAHPQAADSQPHTTTPGTGGQPADTTTTTQTPPPSSLVAPTLLSPANGTVFNTYPRTTTVTWSPVSGAATYTVEVMYCQNAGPLPRGAMPVLCPNATRLKLLSGLQGTSATFDFVGAQPGIWHVWAVDGNGSAGPTSLWSRFSYTK